MTDDQPLLRGTLHAFVAFDWGEEIRLDEARRPWPARSGELIRRPRTPPSIAYRPAPLQFCACAAAHSPAGAGGDRGDGRSNRFRFRRRERRCTCPLCWTPRRLFRQLAASLADSTAVIQAATAASDRLYENCCRRSGIRSFRPDEEYFVFQFVPDTLGGPTVELLERPLVVAGQPVVPGAGRRAAQKSSRPCANG